MKKLSFFCLLVLVCSFLTSGCSFLYRGVYEFNHAEFIGTEETTKLYCTPGELQQFPQLSETCSSYKSFKIEIKLNKLIIESNGEKSEYLYKVKNNILRIRETRNDDWRKVAEINSLEIIFTMSSFEKVILLKKE